MSKHQRILHLGAGKVDPFDTSDFHIHVDRSYKGLVSTLTELEDAHTDNTSCGHWFIGSDLFEFLDTYKFKFDCIEAFRIYEHMEFCNGEIGRLLEACNMISTPEATMNIIVPNAYYLSLMLKDYEEKKVKWNNTESNNIKLILNSEFCNIKCDPHASVWTPRLAREYIEQEGTWKVSKIEPHVNYGYRDIYMRILCNKRKF